jgi:hypothetical protein
VGVPVMRIRHVRVGVGQGRMAVGMGVGSDRIHPRRMRVLVVAVVRDVRVLVEVSVLRPCRSRDA